MVYEFLHTDFPEKRKLTFRSGEREKIYYDNNISINNYLLHYNLTLYSLLSGANFFSLSISARAEMADIHKSVIFNGLRQIIFAHFCTLCAEITAGRQGGCQISQRLLHNVASVLFRCPSWDI